jgi:hypothetical protein
MLKPQYNPHLNPLRRRGLFIPLSGEGPGVRTLEGFDHLWALPCIDICTRFQGCTNLKPVRISQRESVIIQNTDAPG